VNDGVAVRRASRVEKVLAGWAAYLLIFSWLPLARSFLDGETYQWATTHFGFRFSGAGVGPDLWLPVLKAGLLVYLMWGLLRSSSPLHRWTLLLVNLAWAADATQSYLADPDGFVFRGDTLGIELNLGLTLPDVTGAFAALSVLWFLRERGRANSRAAAVWTDRNHTWLWTLAALLPVQFLLFRFGAPHGTTDAIAVLLTIAQSPLLAVALAPRGSETTG